MSKKKLKRFAEFCIGTMAAWAFAVKPRLFNKPDISEIRRYDYAHRGFTGHDMNIPENSLPAFQAAVDHGYGIVLDVRITRDGVPVVFADSRLERMTGEIGSIENSTAEELKALRLSKTDETIPTLEEALKLINGQVPVLLDLHVENNNYDALADQTCEVLDTYEGVFAVQSVDTRVLRWYRKQRNEYIRGQKVDYTYRSGSGFLNLLWDFLCSSMLLNFLTGPDYITTNIDQRNNPSLWICRILYHVPRMDWVVHSLEDYELVKTDDSIVVFDDIEP